MPPWLDPRNAAIRRRLTFSAPAIWLRWRFIELTASRDRAERFNAVHLRRGGFDRILRFFFRIIPPIFLIYASQFLSRLISFRFVYVVHRQYLDIVRTCTVRISEYSRKYRSNIHICNTMNIHKILIGRWLSARIIILFTWNRIKSGKTERNCQYNSTSPWI